MTGFDFVLDYIENSEDDQTMESYAISTEAITDIFDTVIKALKKAILFVETLIERFIGRIRSLFIKEEHAVMVPRKAFNLYSKFISDNDRWSTASIHAIRHLVNFRSTPDAYIAKIENNIDVCNSYKEEMDNIDFGDRAFYVKLQISHPELKRKAMSNRKCIAELYSIMDSPRLRLLSQETFNNIQHTARLILELFTIELAIYNKLLNFNPEPIEIIQG